jgi:hypothetical protein
MKKYLSAFFVAFLLLPRLSLAVTLTAKVYDENKSKELYKLTIVETPSDAGEHRVATYFAPDGKSIFEETTEIENGKLKSYKIDQPAAQVSGKVETSGKKLLFSYSENGKTKTDDEDFKDNTIVPSTTKDFIVKHWDAILKGEDVDARFAVVDRRETVGFTFFKVGEEKRGGKDVVLIRMKPTSFIIAAILPKPVIFVLDKASRQNLEFRGRLPFKLFENGKLSDQDGTIVYDTH